MSDEKQLASDEKQLAEAPFVVVGIDYGTTHSGAAWAKSGALDQVEVIAQWTSQNFGGNDSEKVPSDICYGADGRPSNWGFGLSSEDNPLRWTKLLLCPLSMKNMPSPSKKEEDVVDGTRKQLKHLKKSPVEVISHYLRFLWQHILQRLRDRLTAPILDNMILKVVLTVPAIWDHTAHKQMREAAKRAGILDHRPCGKTEVTLVAEPAAAALATYYDSDIKDNPIVEAGDSFVVCDAGGGTVDLISYTVKSFEPFRLEECVGAAGDLCGAVYVDRAFLKHVKTFRKHMNTLSPEAERRFMEREWEHNAKRNYDGSSRLWPVELPQDLQRGRSTALKSVFKKEQSNILQLEREHLHQIFNKVVEKIILLLADQVKEIKRTTGASPKLIILVGGFGANRYLLRQIKENFSSILIQQPSKAWSAVSRGAVYGGAQGGQPIVSNHISKYYYGIEYHTDWIDGKHHPDDKTFNEIRKKYRAKGQIRWYLKKGDNVQQLNPPEYTFCYDYFDASELKKGESFNIYYSDHEDPGTRVAEHVHRLCKVKLDLSIFPFESFPKLANTVGEEYTEVPFLLKMAVTVASVDWKVYCQGQIVKTHVVYYDSSSSAREPT